MSREKFRIRDYEWALCMMGYTSDNLDVSNISSGQDSDLDVNVQSGSSRNKDSGKFCSYSCYLSKNYM